MINPDQEYIRNKAKTIANYYVGGASVCWEHDVLLTTGVYDTNKAQIISDNLADDLVEIIMNDRREMLEYYIKIGPEEAKNLLDIITINIKETI
jgi:hypothetical protein